MSGLAVLILTKGQIESTRRCLDPSSRGYYLHVFNTKKPAARPTLEPLADRQTDRQASVKWFSTDETHVPTTCYHPRVIVDTRFPKRTVDRSTWAVTLFGDWRAHGNRLCLEGNADASVYIDKYGVTPSFLNCIDLLRHNIE